MIASRISGLAYLAYPEFIVFKDGEPVQKKIGAMPKENILEMVD